MNKPRFNLIFVFLLAMATAAAFGQGTLTLIGPSIQNGSFEAGIPSPWTGDLVISNDVGFASHGESFAVVSGATPSGGSIVRRSIFQRPVADPNNGFLFSLNFDARNGTAAFEGIRVFFSARNSDQTAAFATDIFFTLPSANWQSYRAEFQVPSAWTGGQVSLGLQFENFSAIVGNSYVGYLDNVVLTQIPEPSTLALVGLGSAWLAATRWRRFKS